MQKIYSATLFYRGTEKTPDAAVIGFFEQQEIQKSSVDAEGKKTAVKVAGYKRKDVPIKVAYEVPEGTPDFAILAIERMIHLWAKDIADAYKEVPTTLDTASFVEYLTPERGAASGLDTEYIKAGLAALQQFVLTKTAKPALAESTAYCFKNYFSSKAIMSPKGLNVKAVQVVKVLTQFAGLLQSFAEAPDSDGYEQLIDSWGKALTEEITALSEAENEENLFSV